MLSSLKIENVAVIEKAQARFTPGLNVLTGETGAGKSILIDSINAILGNRTSRDLVRTGAAKACVWATFTDLSPRTRALLEQAGYEAEEELLLYREISAEGKGGCRINGMPATAAVLREIGGSLINIHGQHDSQSLTNPARHLALLDTFAQDQPQLDAYQQLYRQLIRVKRQMDALEMDETEKQRRIEILQFQLQEIEQARLQPGEEERLQTRRQVLAHAQTILQQLSAAHAAISGDDDTGGAADGLGAASSAMEQAAALDSELQPLAEKLNEYYYGVRDMAEELAQRLESAEAEPGELDRIEERLDLLYRLRQKYGTDLDGVLAFAEKARAELETIQSSQQQLEELAVQKQRLYKEAKQAAESLTQARLAAFESLQGQLVEALTFLNMPGIRFVLRHSRGPLASAGQDSVEFYISANAGEEPKPLAKIASGGELSRIMLALKSALADKDDIPTVIYDEIDTGVSGLAAGRIGEKLRQTSRGRQVLCITHTAQIAALADTHLLIAKQVEGARTYTQIHPLDDDGRVEVLARIISGDHVTELSLANAREMLQQGRA